MWDKADIKAYEKEVNKRINEELLETIATIKSVIENNQFDNICFAGDLNSDFERESSHVRTVNDFLNDAEIFF